MQPGQVITPGQQPDDAKPLADGAPVPDRPAEDPGTVPAPTPLPEPKPAEPLPAVPAAEPQPAAPEAPQTGGWQFTQETTGVPEPDHPLPDSLSWTAAEFVEHQKGIGWYGLLVAGGLLAAALDYVITKDKLTPFVIVFVAIALGYVASRKPQTQSYSLSRRGLQVGNKVYELQDFKAFSVAEEGASASVVLLPLRRFMPPLTIYMAPDNEDQIVDYLSALLPFEQHKVDAVDGLLRRMRF